MHGSNERPESNKTPEERGIIPPATAQREGRGGWWAHPTAADPAPQTALEPGRCASSTPLRMFGCSSPATHHLAISPGR